MGIRVSAVFSGAEGTLQATVDNFNAAAALVSRLAAAADEKNRLAVTLTAEGGGRFPLSSPVTFDSTENHGLAYTSLVMESEGGRASFTGNQLLDGKAFAKTGKYYTYQFPKDKDGKYPRFRDFYVDGRRIPVCRTEEYLYPVALATENNRDVPENYRGIWIPEAMAAKLTGEKLFPSEIMMLVEWEFFVLHMDGIDRKETMTGEDGTRFVLATIPDDEMQVFVMKMNRCNNIRGRQTTLANNPGLLTPGTFCYDHETGVLCYCPEKGKTPGKATLEVPMLEKLLIFRGMDGITCRGLDFTGVTSRYLCDHGFPAGQANTLKVIEARPDAAAISTRSVRNFTMEDCGFKELGSNGLNMLDDSAIVRISRCRFENIAMSALSIGNPVHDWSKPENRLFDVHVENNYFRHIGYEYPAAVAFYVSCVDTLVISHNTMIETAYSAISVGWFWAQVHHALGEMVNVRDADISYNKIIDYMQVLRDGAAVYVVGANCRKEDTRQFNRMHDNYAERELFDGSKRGYYLDGSSSNWAVYDSVTSGTPFPVFSQFHVPSQYTWNNRIDRIYTTDEMPAGNHHPERNTLVGDEIYYEPDLAKLLAKYPKAKEIRDAAGCDFE